jgi:diadenylate cyclase
MTYFLIWDILKPAIEIFVLWLVYYRILVFFAGTRAFQVLKGITYLVIAFLASKLLGFDTLNWLLTKFFAISIVAFLIIFQQELRQGLARLGQQHIFNLSLHELEIIAIIDEISSAVFKMSKAKVGCLIAIERETKLSTYIESGLVIDSKISAEILQSIFSPQSPIHDGGVIIRSDRIVAAACLFPLTENPRFSKTMGTRHRASVGISEQTDALVIMVSEETGDVSLVQDGRFLRIDKNEILVDTLKNLLVPNYQKRKK